MSAVKLRSEIKKVIDKLPTERLESLADYARYLNRPNLLEQILEGEKEIAAGKGVNWRKIKRNV